MNNVTLIDDLPNLEDLEQKNTSRGMSILPPNEMSRYQKYIRNNGITTPTESGMNPVRHNIEPEHTNNTSRFAHSHPQENNYDPNISTRDMYMPYKTKIAYDEYNTTPPPKVIENYGQGYGTNTCTCIDVADHTATCIVCSKLYNSNNFPFYMAIGFLLLLNLILLKCILEKSSREKQA